MILAISAILVANISAQEQKKEAKEKKQFEPGKELTDKELDQLAKKRFAGMKKFAAVQEKFYDKFRKDLSARQVEKVLRLKDSSCEKNGCGQKCHKHEKGEEKAHKHEIRK